MLIINWKPDKTSFVPLYKQIVEYIKEKIASAEWCIGSKLPTQRELAKIFKVNRSTVSEAFDELKAMGLIEGKSSKGTVIVNNTWSLLASVPSHNWQKYIENSLHQPNLSIIQEINKLEFQKNIIRLGTGEISPELFPKKKMQKVLNRISNDMNSLGYEEPKGSIELRRILSKHIERFGVKASPNSILVVSGSLQALQLISIGVLQTGSTILTEQPSYIKSLHTFQSAGMKLKGLKMDGQGIRTDEICRAMNKNATLLYTIPTFHNPTGIVMTEHRRAEILTICGKERLPIIEDDAYRELWLDAEPPLPLKARDKNGIVLYMGTISKSLCPGIRIGWLVGPEPVIERLGDIKMQTDYGASSLSQLAAAEWISSGLYEEYVQELRDKLRVRREIALNVLKKYFSDIADWNKPAGGFYIWLTLRKQVAIKKLFEACCNKGILINPGSIYDFHSSQSIRISYAYASLEDLERGLKTLSEIIKGFY